MSMGMHPTSKGPWARDAFLALGTWGLVASYFVVLSGEWGRAVRACLSPWFPDAPFQWGVWAANGGGFVGAVGATLAVAMAYGMLGRRLCRVVGLGEAPIPLRFALGAVTSGSLFLALGLCGLWFKPLLLGVLSVGILLGSFDWVMAWVRQGDARGGYDRGRWVPSDGPMRFAFFAALPIPLLALAFGFLPDIFYDTQVYHLAVPEVWMARHGIVDLPEKVFASFPYLGEFILLPGGWLTAMGDGSWLGTAAPRLMGWTAWVLAAVLAGRWAREIASDASEVDGGRAAGRAAFLLTVACPLFCLNQWSSQVEGVSILMGMCFLYALDKASRSEEGKGLGWAVAAGSCFGAVGMVKYNGFLIGVVAVPWFYRLVRRKRPWAGLAVFGLAAGAMVLPWLLKDGVLTGNPLAPYLSRWFGGRALWPEGLHQMMAEQREWHVQSPGDWLTLPWRLVMDSPNGYNFVGPMALVCVLWLVLTRRRTLTEKSLAWGCAFAFAAGLSVTHLLRFEAVLFPPLFTVAAASCASRPFIRRTFPLAFGLVSLGVLPFLLGMALVHYSPQGVWTGREDTTAYLRRAGVTPYASVVEMVRRGCPPSERVLLAGDARTLGYGRDMSAGSVFDEPALVKAAREEADAPGILRRLERLGVDDVAVNLQEGLRVGSVYPWYRLDEGDWRKLDRFFTTCTDLVGAGELSQLYRLRKAPVETPLNRSYYNGIVFLDPAACAYVKSVRVGDSEGRQKNLSDLCERQTFTPQWWAEQAVVWGQEGRDGESLQAWKKASALGILPREQYRDWALEAKKAKRPRDAAEAVALERKWYGAEPSGTR